MSNRIQAQATKLWQTIAAPETATNYRNVLSVTWTILQEVTYLFWLVLCLGLVFVDWFWRLGYRSGSDLRNWVSNMKEPDPNRMLSSTGESLVTVGKTGVIKALNAAKAQLGIEAEPIPTLSLARSNTPPAPLNTSTTPLEPLTDSVTNVEPNPPNEA